MGVPQREGWDLTRHELRERLRELRRAALDTTPVSGLTHRFYRYPARFSPRFAAAAIKAFSKPRDLILDPFMGGGTTIIEALITGRQAVGCDLNSLAVFLTRVKTTTLTPREREVLLSWADYIVPLLTYSVSVTGITEVLSDSRTRNLQLPAARAKKKVIALALATLERLPGRRARDFARCALLHAGQWALNGPERHITSAAFRARLRDTVHEMLSAMEQYELSVQNAHKNVPLPPLINDSAENLPRHRPFSEGRRADLVVTSPPYPGVHVIYHRWQVDGRHETPAPYWIAASKDGRGEAFYNLGDRHERGHESYFSSLFRTFVGIRRVMRRGALVVQMVAFGDPCGHLPRYLRTMQDAGFEELRTDVRGGRTGPWRIWRCVPNRTWHASLKGPLPSSREVVLVHRAV